jgi:glycosyltransferase involved in cell wall biosynthesis
MASCYGAARVRLPFWAVRILPSTLSHQIILLERLMKKIKVLQVLTSMDFGGVERYVYFLVKHLDRSRFDVAVAASEKSVNLRLLESLDVEFYPIKHLGKAIHPLQDWLAYRELSGLMARGHFDVVHTHMFKAGMLGRIAAWMNDVPAVLFTAHGFHFNTFRNPILKGFAMALERFLAGFSHMVLPVSQTEARQAVSLGILPLVKIRPVYPGIDTACSPLKPEVTERLHSRIGWKPGDRLIGTVGRLARQKAPMDLVKAASLIREQCRNVHVVFVGDGPLRPQVEEEIQRLGLKACVHILGFCTEIDSLLSMLDIFVLPSLYEGQPISIMEAMRNAIPVVAADVNGVGELVQHDQTGMLISPSRPEQLAKTVLELLNDPARRERLAQAGRSHLEKYYSVQGMVEKIQHAYLDLLFLKEARITCSIN